MQTTAIGTVANSLPENEAILLTILISDGYIPYTDLLNNSAVIQPILRANNKIPERINNEATKSFPEKPVGDENLDFCSIVSMIND